METFKFMASLDNHSSIGTTRTHRDQLPLPQFKQAKSFDSAVAPAFDRITALAADLFCVPNVIASFVDPQQHWFVAKQGIDISQISGELAFATHAFYEDELYVVEDALADPLFKFNPLVQDEPHIRFYASAVIKDQHDRPIGALCIFDSKQHLFGPSERNRLLTLSQILGEQMLTLIKPSSALTAFESNKDPVIEAYLGNAFFEAIKHVNSNDNNCSYYLVYLKLTNIEILSDTYGRVVSDQVLLGLTNRLRTYLSSIGETIIGRMEGNRLAAHVKLKDIPANIDEQLSEISTRIAERLDGPIPTSIADLDPQAAVMSLFEFGGMEVPQDVLRMMRISLDKLQRKPGITSSIVTHQLRAQTKILMELARYLPDAIAENELRLVFQPKVETSSLQVIGYECLLRWDHPAFGYISPIDIMDIARDSNKLFSLEQWIFTQAFRQLETWKSEGRRLSQLSINITGGTLLLPEFQQWLQDFIKSENVDASLIDIEILESSLFEDFESITQAMNSLSQLGISFSLDDFGTGFSSLSYLRALPISNLKIDKSFIDEIAESQEAAALCSAIILMARELGLKTIAEGVETELQHVTLRALRCDAIQGYYFAKPLEVEQVIVTVNDEGYINRP